MLSFCIKDVVCATGGELLCGDPQRVVTDVVTDSRLAGEGTLFVPIIGERVDAHRFIPEVLQAGATALTSKREAADGAEGTRCGRGLRYVPHRYRNRGLQRENDRTVR